MAVRVRSQWDKARFYPIEGRELPSVTTALEIIDKSDWLVGWSVKQEREAFRVALLEVLSGPHALNPEMVYRAVEQATKGVKAADKVKQKAAEIGKAAHAWIEWRTRRTLGEDPGPEPNLSDAAMVAVMAWEDWVKAVDFKPIAAEHVVHCLDCGYAGTLDWVGEVKGIMTLGDYKTARAIYPKDFLQNIAYRHAARRQGFNTKQGLILRLPKTIEDPAFESMVVPETPLEDFLAALRLWRWKRTMDGQTTGTRQKGAS